MYIRLIKEVFLLHRKVYKYISIFIKQGTIKIAPCYFIMQRFLLRSLQLYEL